MKNYILDLINRMSGERDDHSQYRGSNKVSWKAYREAEQLKELNFFPFLKEFIHNEKSINKQEKAFIALGYLATNLKEPEILEWMLSQANKDTPESLLYAIFSSVAESRIFLKKHLDKVAYFTDDDREMVRNAAIRALGWDASKSSGTEEALIEVLKHYYDKYDLGYAVNSLEKVGTMKSVPYLEQVLNEVEDEEIIKNIKSVLKKLKKKPRDFFIQLGHPKINNLKQSTFEELKEVFRFLFRENEESVYLFWHRIPIRFHYAYELYININELVSILWLVYSREKGANKTHLTTESLFVEWEVRWEEKHVYIKSAFTAKKNSYQLYAEALNQFPDLHISKQEFLAEWNTLALQLIKSIQTAGIHITSSKEHLKFEVLQKIAANIPNYGILYTKD